MDCSTCSNIMANKFAWAILCSGHGSLGDWNDCCSSCHQRRRHFDKLFDQPMVTKRERQCFLGNRPPHSLDLDSPLTFFAPVFFIILQSKPLNLCTGQELGWKVHSMQGHRSHFCIKYSTRGGVLLHPLHSTLALLSNCSMVIMLWFHFWLTPLTNCAAKYCENTPDSQNGQKVKYTLEVTPTCWCF